MKGNGGKQKLSFSLKPSARGTEGRRRTRAAGIPTCEGEEMREVFRRQWMLMKGNVATSDAVTGERGLSSHYEEIE